jgi:hypothetical protein
MSGVPILKCTRYSVEGAPCPGITGALADDEELELDERSRAARDLLRSAMRCSSLPRVKPRPVSVYPNHRATGDAGG